MKDHLLQIVASLPAGRRRGAAREYLHVYLLRLLHDEGALRSMAFVGGTALRLLHGLPRFSEDLDFSATGPQEIEEVFGRVRSALAMAGYEAGLKVKARGAVVSGLFRFGGLAREIGYSTDPRTGLRIRIEVDTRPPPGATIETSLLGKFFPVAVRHHDLASMLAGKIHAVITRPYAKGRDWYDLVWYLTEKRGLEPNLTLLGNALEQTGHARTERWREAVVERMASLDWKAVLEDVRPFLERPGDVDHLERDLVEKLLKTT